MKVLITGALGQDGSILSEEYLKRGHQVLGVSSPKRANQFGSSLISTVNLSDSDQLNSLFNEFRPDMIFHLAAVHHSSTNYESAAENRLSDMESCHIEITRNILEWQRLNPSTRSLVSLSSQMFSSRNGNLIIDEKAELDPQNDYARTKAEAFRMLGTYRKNYGIKCYGAILFNHTSARSKSEFLFPQLAKQIARVLRGKSSEICVNNAEATLDICAAEEICLGMMKLIEISLATDMVFSRGSAIKVKDLIEKTMIKLGFNKSYIVIENSIDKEMVPSLIGNPSKALNLIGWQAIKKPEDILIEMVNILND